jgi:hypothetical protein
MPDDDFVSLVTSEKWWRDLAELLDPPEFDPYLLLESYASRGASVPAWVGRAVLETRRPSKGGRHTLRRRAAEQCARDFAMAAAVEYLVVNDGAKLTHARVRVGQLMRPCLSGQAVADACRRAKARLKRKDGVTFSISLACLLDSARKPTPG